MIHNCRTLVVRVCGRYWEESCSHIDCMRGRHGLELRIDIGTGIVLNWRGQAVDVYYKAVDRGIYTLLDAAGDEVARSDRCYVPGFLRSKTPPSSDYIALKIDENGKINNWEFKIDEMKIEYKDVLLRY